MDLLKYRVEAYGELGGIITRNIQQDQMRIVTKLSSLASNIA